ncbi:MAG: hypothetical protein NTW13_03190, partial [Candidatus Omnitrophica bacterium]|nr:hypothetical protein [Candidatus Omnitrophota bacterium]
DALNLYRDDILSNNRQVTLLDKDYWYPKAGNIITLALERVKGKKLSDLHSLNPLYLYPKECQIRKA